MKETDVTGWASWVRSVRGSEEWGAEGVHDLCLSFSWSFDLKAGKDEARNKCLGHDILSMLGHHILAIWWQMTEQQTGSHLWSNSVKMKLWAAASEHSRKELKLNLAASLFLFGEWWAGGLPGVLFLSFSGFCFLPSWKRAALWPYLFPLAWNYSWWACTFYLKAADRKEKKWK